MKAQIGGDNYANEHEDNKRVQLQAQNLHVLKAKVDSEATCATGGIYIGAHSCSISHVF